MRHAIGDGAHRNRIGRQLRAQRHQDRGVGSVGVGCKAGRVAGGGFQFDRRTKNRTRQPAAIGL